jgi:hypothetical protein
MEKVEEWRKKCWNLKEELMIVKMENLKRKMGNNMPARIKRILKGESDNLPAPQDGCVLLLAEKDGYIISVTPDESTRGMVFVTDEQLMEARQRKEEQDEKFDTPTD